MADHDDYPYIVIERRADGIGAFLWGALLGAGVALLLAPRSGRDLRNGIRSGALELRDRAEDAVRGVADSVTGAIGDVRHSVEDRLDAARDAFEAGRRAARESRREMEDRVREVRAGVRGGIDAARRADGATQATEPAPRPIHDIGDDLGV